MLLSSMDHLNYYSMPKESFLQLDTGLNDGGYDLQGDDQYLNEENSPKNGTKSSLYKTELCKRFSEFGNCRYGAKCQFAHGLGELRHVVRHPKYKTTKCKSYWGSGHCPYGSRCRFIHEEVEGYSTPQYSPQASSGMGGMGSMFMSNDKDHMGLGSLGVAVPSDNNSSFLYGSGAVDQVNQPLHPLGGSMPSYPKDYSLLSSFDKSGSWGTMGGPAVPARTATQSKLNYAGDHHHHLQQQSLHPLTHHQPSLHHHFGSAPTSGSSGGLMPLSSPTNHHHHHSTQNSNSNSNYPDLQDAIDALMKFSLTQDDEEDDVPPAVSPRGPTSGSASSAANAPIGTISTSPVETSSPATGASSAANTVSSSSTESDELWKDFPVASAQASVEKLDTTSWSSGLVLTLDTSKPFDVNEKKSGSGSEHSPRLSVFERFH